MDNQEKYVFISYAHKDYENVHKLIVALEHIACNIWFDSGIEKGAQWSEDIARHLLDSECVLWFVTKASIESKYVMGEINFAVTHDKTIIPVFIENVQMPLGVELLLGQIQSVILYSYDKLSEKRNTLMKALPKDVFFQASIPFFASDENLFFINDRSVDFPDGTYFAGETDCSYDIGFSATGDANDQASLFKWRAAPGYDMIAKITSITVIRDNYLRELDNKVAVFNISLLFSGKYPVPWPDFDGALTVALYDANTNAPKFKLLGAEILTVNGNQPHADEKEYDFVRNKLDEIVQQINQ